MVKEISHILRLMYLLILFFKVVDTVAPGLFFTSQAVFEPQLSTCKVYELHFFFPKVY